MIRFRCPRCHKSLRLNEAQPGQVSRCPQCQGRFRIPALPATDEFTAAPRSESDPREEDDEPARAGRQRRHSEEDDNDSANQEEEQRLPVRKRRRKRRHPAVRLLAWLSGWPAALLALTLVAVVSLGLSLRWPEAAVPLLGLGAVLVIGAELWFMVVAFQVGGIEEVWTHSLPFYRVSFLINNFDEVKWPLFLEAAGVILLLVGLLVVVRQQPPPEPRTADPIRLVCGGA
jgi:DNA-directed RNA polymerase subunit RPC12/RpoP